VLTYVFAMVNAFISLEIGEICSKHQKAQAYKTHISINLQLLTEAANIVKVFCTLLISCHAYISTQGMLKILPIIIKRELFVWGMFPLHGCQ
jgi:hypothetical protein